MSTSLLSKLFLIFLGLSSFAAEYDSRWSKKFLSSATVAAIVEVDYFTEDESVHFKLIEQIKGKAYPKKIKTILQLCCGVQLKPFDHGLQPGEKYLIILEDKNLKQGYVGDMNIMLIQEHKKVSAIYNKFEHNKFEWQSITKIIKSLNQTQKTKKEKMNVSSNRTSK